MDRGRVTDEGTHDELMERGGIYADLYRLQYRDGKTVSDARGLSALSAKKRRERARQPNLLQRIGAAFFN